MEDYTLWPSLIDWRFSNLPPERLRIEDLRNPIITLCDGLFGLRIMRKIEDL